MTIRKDCTTKGGSLKRKIIFFQRRKSLESDKIIFPCSESVVLNLLYFSGNFHISIQKENQAKKKANWLELSKIKCYTAQ